MTSSEVASAAFRIVSFILDCSALDGHRCHSYDIQKEEGRLAWGTIGDFIESASFLPITINVPDVLYGMYDMFNHVGDYFFGSENESTPRIWQLLRELNDELPDL